MYHFASALQLLIHFSDIGMCTVASLVTWSAETGLDTKKPPANKNVPIATGPTPTDNLRMPYFCHFFKNMICLFHSKSSYKLILVPQMGVKNKDIIEKIRTLYIY